MPPVSKRKKRRVKLEKRERKSDLSQDGNKAHSFKSVTSYVLGDLDLSRDEKQSSNSDTQEELGSFEISSNSSMNLASNRVSTPRSDPETPTKHVDFIKKPPVTVMRSKQFSEDRLSQ